MTPSPPIIFTPHHLQILGLEHDPQRQNEATPFPHVHDPITNISVFFNPMGCMISFRMLERALARLKIDSRIYNDAGKVVVNTEVHGECAGTFSCAQSIDMIECYVAAALICLEKIARQSALVSP